MPSASGHYEMAVSQWADKQAEAAITELHRALALSPNLQKARLNLAHIYIVLNRHEEAQEELRRLIRQDPNDDIAYDYVAKLFCQKARQSHKREDWLYAKEAYQHSLLLKPEDAGTLDQLAIVLLELGEYAAAMEASHAAVMLAPHNRKIIHNESAIGGQAVRRSLARGQWKEAWQLWTETWRVWKQGPKARQK